MNLPHDATNPRSGSTSPAARRPPTRLLAATLTTLAAIGATLPARGADGTARDVVYVESNDPNGNAILAYRRDGGGALTPLPGSPFATGGLGLSFGTALGPFDSDNEIVVDPAHRFLFAVNGGSDSIAVFRIAANGSLRPVDGSPFPSGGPNPVGLGLAGNILCVVNKGANPGHPGGALPNYTTFRVTTVGSLLPIPKSTVYDENGSDPTEALVAPGGNLVFGADFLGGALRSFGLAANGRLDARAVLPLPAAEYADSGAPPLPLGLAVHPTRPLLYVGFVTINRVGIYRYDPAGRLRFVRSVPNTGKGICWLLVNKAATRMYTSNTTDPSVSVYDLKDPAEPVEIQKLNLNVVSGSNAGGYQIALDSTGGFFYVVTQQFATSSTPAANALHVFQVAGDGRLTEVESSPTVLPVPNQTRPQGVVAF